MTVYFVISFYMNGIPIEIENEEMIPWDTLIL